MKKALALILALVLALSMAVSAFALNLVELEAVSNLDTVSKINLEKNVLGTDSEDVYRAPANGGTYYFLLTVNGNYEKLYNVATSATGCVSAEMVEFDPETMETPSGLTWVVTDGVQQILINPNNEKFPAGFEEWQKDCDAQWTKTEKPVAYPQAKDAAGNVITYKEWTYEYAVALAKYLSNGAEVSGKYTAKLVENDGTAATLNVLKLVVEPNYTAAYKLGEFKVTATLDKAGKKPVAFTGDVVSDVTIFEYEQVKWAAEEENALVVGAKGYSHYETDGNYGPEYKVTDLRKYEGASVISTTEFRAIREAVKGGINVKSAGMLVTIPEIAAAQKGVNFAGYTFTELDADGLPVALTGEDLDSIVFGFYGNQVIKSEFTVTAKLPYTYYELREAFGEAVEEDDIVTYYLLKDGKVAQEIVVDYMTADIDDQAILVIEDANSTLGQYEIRIDVEVTGEAGEENPNTGAESVVGVVAALAVVSVATAAAVSLKK